MELLPAPRPDGQMPGRDDDTIDVLAVVGVLRRRKWFVLSVAAAGALVGLFLGLWATPEYTAQATVVVEPREEPLAEDQARPRGYSEDPGAFGTQQQIIQSRALVARIMADLGLFDDPEFNPALRSTEDDGFSVYAALAKLVAAVPNSWLVATGLADVVQPAATEQPVTPERAQQRAVDAFKGLLEVGSEEGTWVITVDFTSIDPAKAAVIANRTAELYVQSQIDAKSANIGETSRWLREQVKQLREEVRTAEAAVERYRAEHDLLDANEVSLSDQQLADINRELVGARAELAAQRAKLQEVEDLRRRGQLDAVAEVVDSPVIIGLRQQETELLRKEAELAQEYGQRHPRDSAAGSREGQHRGEGCAGDRADRARAGERGAGRRGARGSARGGDRGQQDDEHRRPGHRGAAA